MEGAPTDFWGKLDRVEEGPVRAWHPLAAHCADVAAVAEALLERSLIRRRLAALAGLADLDATTTARLAALSALHDLGKFNHGFQRKGDATPRDTAGHVREVLGLFCSDYDVARRFREALPEALYDWGPEGQAHELLIAAIGHHGRPMRCDSSPVDPSLWEEGKGRDPIAGAAALARRVEAWFPRAFTDGPALPNQPAFQHAFAGVVMLADWLGSDRHDDFFPFASTEEDRMAFARERAARAVRWIGLDAGPARASLGTKLPGFQEIFDNPPRDAQVATMSLPCSPGGSISVLESETGSGKTEAAIMRFARLFHEGWVDGMTFALPTRTAATQIHRRITSAVTTIFPDVDARPAVVLAVPGYLQVDDVTGKRLPGFEVLWNDREAERARHRGWPAEQPKRYLAGTVVVGTIDQVLLSSLRVSHAHLRASSLLRHFLVVDEVHASDTYMNRILHEVLRFHVQAGGHALLMSATLGTTTRAMLESALAKATPPITLKRALTVPYPALHDAVVGRQPVCHPVEAPGLPKRVFTRLASLADHPEALVEEALRAASKGARVLVIRNTVSDAVETQGMLEEALKNKDLPLRFRVRGIPTLHHARFARADRLLLDEEIERRLGKGAPAHGGVIVIATQTVQQSLDLDADLLFTDLAPMDVLLQRFGRVHRHRERDPARPEGYRSAQAVVLVGDEPLSKHIRPKGEARGPHGAGTVYDDLVVLEATRRRLVQGPELSIPEHNRELVEVTTHPEALDNLVKELGAPWDAHRNGIWGKTFSHKGLATLNLVDRAARFGDYEFNENGLTERISARLGESDRKARFEPPPRGPFGELLYEITLPGWLVRGEPTDPELAPSDVKVTEDSQGITVRFCFGSKPFAYDRLGLRGQAAPTQDDDTADA